MKKKDHHYSGDASTSFWKRVNALDGEDHAVLYSLGCVLQHNEEFVLKQLAIAESSARDKRALKKARRAS
jgi:hypothetical protein